LPTGSIIQSIVWNNDKLWISAINPNLSSANDYNWTDPATGNPTPPGVGNPTPKTGGSSGGGSK